jgi:predicted permease
MFWEGNSRIQKRSNKLSCLRIIFKNPPFWAVFLSAEDMLLADC